MANSYYFIDPGGTNYYLSGTTNAAYTGSGTPWTAQTTTPYSLGMNEVTGQRWTPQVQPLDAYYGTLALPLQMQGNSHDNAVILKQTLARLLNTADFTQPLSFAVQPDGSTNVAYYAVYGGLIQETPGFINDEQGNNLLRAIVTLKVSARSTIRVNTNGETVINAVSMGNKGTGAPDDMEAYSAGSGDLLSTREGQPLNLYATFSASADKVYLATAKDRQYMERADSLVTSSTTGVSVALTTVDCSTLMTSQGVNARILGRITSPSSNLETAMVVQTESGSTIIYQSPWISVDPTTSTLFDYGRIPIGIFRLAYRTNPTIYLSLSIRSTNGSATSGTLDYVETLFYYEFCRLDGSIFNSTVEALQIRQFSDSLNVPAVPFRTPRAFATTNTLAGTFREILTVRGMLPKVHTGCSLYLSWHDETTLTHTTTRTATVTAYNSPQWHTFRGSD
jgi:hypothetical protein